MSRLFRPGDGYIKTFSVSSSTGAAVNADSTPTGQCYRNGAADGAVTVTITNPEAGIYKASFTIPNTYAAGDVVELEIAATVSTVASKAVVDAVRLVAFNSQDSVRLGITALPNAAAGANGGLPTGNASGQVTVGGYGTNQDPATLLLTTPANKLATDASGGVTVGAYEASKDPASYVLATPANKLASDASGNVTVGAYKTGQDPATLLFTTPANKLATDASGGVTVGAYEATKDPGTYILATPANKLTTDSSGRVTVAGYATGQDPASLTLITPANKLASDSSGRVTVAGYASGQDPASLVLATPANKLTTDASGNITVGTVASAALTAIGNAVMTLTNGVLNGLTPQGALRTIFDLLTSTITGANTASPVVAKAGATIGSASGNRMTATTDATGNRSAITVDPT